MYQTKPLLHRHISNLIPQILTIIIKDIPFNSSVSSSTNPWTTETITQLLRSIPRFFFQSTRSIGIQNDTVRHRSPMRQQRGPAPHRDPAKIQLGLAKSTQFFFWVESQFGFKHNEATVKEMAIVIVKSHELNNLWEFLKEMSRKDGRNEVVTTMTITCLIKCLGEEGLVNEALHAFYRMKQFHCKPDVYAYNTVILALCRVGFFRKAKFLLEQMELPGFWCPPDKFTYTILISSYCKYSMQSGARKAIRRRLWEANHLFRLMLFKGFEPDVVTYNCLIDGCCKTYRIERALELFEDMNQRKCVPNRVTYNSFVRYYSAVNEVDKAIEMVKMMRERNHGIPTCSSYTPIIHSLCEAGRVTEARDFLVELVNGGSIPREYTYKLVCDALNSIGESDLLDKGMRKGIEDGILNRYRHVMKIKPFMNRKGSFVTI